MEIQNQEMQQHSGHTIIETVFRYKNQILSVIGCAFIIGAGIWGYKTYQVSVQKSAYKAFAEAYSFHEGLVDEQKETSIDAGAPKVFSSDIEKWMATERAFLDEYAKHSSSALGPVFLAFASSAQLNLGKFSDALSNLERAVAGMPSGAIKQYYTVKLALMQTDSSDVAAVAKGLATLNSLAAEDDLPVHDYVLYVLGSYYWAQKEFKKAENFWNILEHKYGSNTENPSSWYEEIKEKLALISGN